LDSPAPAVGPSIHPEPWREQAEGARGILGDVAENRDFTFLIHEMEISMAEIARHVVVCGSAIVKAIQNMESAA
jgi:hypothetical protein